MTEIVKHEHGPSEVVALPINSMQDLVTLGQFVQQSGMLGASTPAAGLMIAATCQQESMSLLEFGRRYHVDNRGKVTMRSDRMLAEFMAMGGTVEWLQWDAVKASGKWSYGSNVDKLIEFTYKEAEEAGYIKSGSNWEKDPAAQLRARVITRAVRMICPAAVAGVYCPEEMQDVYATEPEQAPPQAMTEEKAAQVVQNATQQQQPAQTTQQTQQTTQQPTNQQQDIPVTNQANQQTQQQNDATRISPMSKAPDFNLCPMGGNCAGKAWADLETNTLQAALKASHAAMQKGHYNAIKQVLEKRG